MLMCTVVWMLLYVLETELKYIVKVAKAISDKVIRYMGNSFFGHCLVNTLCPDKNGDLPIPHAQ